MVVAALMADGTSEIEEIGHIERGYENIVEKLRGLGAEISKVEQMCIRDRCVARGQRQDHH